MASPEDKSVVQRLSEVGVGGVGVDSSKRIKRDLIKKSRDITKSLEDLRTSDKVLNLYSRVHYLLLHQRLHQLASHPLSELQVPEYHRFDIPYWQVPFERTGRPVLATKISPKLEIWSGILSSFDVGLRALVVDMAMRVYASELLQTPQLAEALVEDQREKLSAKNFEALVARKKASLEAELLLAMSHSFREDYVLAVAFAMPDGPDGERHLVGSIGAVKGRTTRPLGSTIGWDGGELTEGEEKLLSSLPTNTALNYELNEMGRTVADVPENRVAEITRLNVAPRAIAEQFGVKERGLLSQKLMYIIHLAIQENMPDVVLEIFNTQLPLHRMINQMGLPAEIISQDSTVVPTPLVLKSIHGHYFQRTPPIPQIMSVEQAVEVTLENMEVAQ